MHESSLRAALDNIAATDNHTRHPRHDATAWQPQITADFLPGEPIGPRPPSRWRRRGRLGLTMFLLAGGGWGLAETEATWRPLASALVGYVTATLDKPTSEAARVSAPGAGGAPAVQDGALQSALSTPLTERHVADAPGAAAGTAVVTPTAAASTPAAQQAGDSSATPESTVPDGQISSSSQGKAAEAPPAPLPPPKVDPADPYQKRALAVGLHPELSRVLLSRMSDADYRNAGVAIRKALAEVGDAEKLVWPPRAEPKLALFQVQFVTAATNDCRRYVVTVLKDGWATTALPLERCGLKRPGKQAL